MANNTIDLKVTADYSDIQVMRRELVGVSKDAKASASVFDREFNKVERQLTASASSAQKYYTETYKLDRAHKSAAQSASVFEKEIEQQAQAFHRLKMSTDASYASTNKLQAAKKILKREVRENGMAVEQYVEAMRKVVQANNAMGASAGAASKHMSRGGVAMQQVGYQVGDFIVQVQSGQNPMVAFGQQATQLVGALYMLPPAALAGRVALMGLSVSVGLLIASLGIIIPLATAIGAALMRTREAADKGTAGLNSYEEALGRVIEKAKALKNERLSLTTNFDADAMIASEKRVKLSNRIVELELMQVGLSGERLEGNKRLVQTLKNLLDEETKVLSTALKSAEAEEARISTLKDAADAKEAEAKAVKDLAKSQRESQDAFQEQLAAQANSLVLLEMEKEGLKGSTQYREELVAQEADRLQKLIDQKAVTEAQAEDALHLYEENLKVTSEMEASTKSAKALSDALREAASAMASLSSFGAGLDKAISVATAKVGALKAGANEAVAGRIAGLRADLDVRLSDKSLRPEAVADIRAENEGKISTLEGLLNQGSDLRASNRKSSKGGGGSKKSPAEGLREYLEGLKQQADIEGKLVGLSGEKRDIQEAVLKAQQKYGEAFGPTQKKQLEAALLQNEAYKEQHRVLEEAKGQQEEVAGVIADSFGSAFMSIVEGTKSAKEAFKDMARSIVKQLFQILVVERMVKSIKGFIGGIGAVQADGGAWQGGSQIQAYANGGVVGGPTYFPMAGGKTGLMGEAGPEAIMPLKRGSNGKLGVQMEGSSQGNVVIHQSFNFQANGDDSVKKLIAQAAPQIANMTQKQIMDSRRRGGSMKAAFG